MTCSLQLHQVVDPVEGPDARQVAGMRVDGGRLAEGRASKSKMARLCEPSPRTQKAAVPPPSGPAAQGCGARNEAASFALLSESSHDRGMASGAPRWDWDVSRTFRATGRGMAHGWPTRY